MQTRSLIYRRISVDAANHPVHLLLRQLQNYLHAHTLQADFAKYCPAWSLHWNYRKRNLLREMLAYKADILCLQEVQSDHFLEFWQPELQKAGYIAIYKKKTAEIYTDNKYAIDGCATFFRRDRFQLVKK
jgi:CCR4-NOT transcription complex subunit 6